MKIAIGASIGVLTVVLLLVWATWSYLMSSMDRTMVLDLLGFASVGGQ